MYTNERTPNIVESTTLPPPLWDGLPPLQRAILSCLMDGAEWSANDLVEECGRPCSRVSTALRDLEALGMADRRRGGLPGERGHGGGRNRDAWRMGPRGWPR